MEALENICSFAAGLIALIAVVVYGPIIFVVLFFAAVAYFAYDIPFVLGVIIVVVILGAAYWITTRI